MIDQRNRKEILRNLKVRRVAISSSVIAGILFMSIGFFVGSFKDNIDSFDFLAYVMIPLWLIAMMGGTYAIWRRCPRCNKRFGFVQEYIKTLTFKCFHCGLYLDGRNVANTSNMNMHLPQYAVCENCQNASIDKNITLTQCPLCKSTYKNGKLVPEE